MTGQEPEEEVTLEKEKKKKVKNTTEHDKTLLQTKKRNINAAFPAFAVLHRGSHLNGHNRISGL